VKADLATAAGVASLSQPSLMFGRYVADNVGHLVIRTAT